MTNIRDAPSNIIDIPSVNYASFFSWIVNLEMQKIDPLKVNQPITNLILLSDSYG